MLYRCRDRKWYCSTGYQRFPDETWDSISETSTGIAIFETSDTIDACTGIRGVGITGSTPRPFSLPGTKCAWHGAASQL